ncbi:cysteine-rich receptor-like protein kinase 2 [Senna tora]|uniref:Cysteine-rich receptor-like protein kinase 2 n=1 Tax=Senna tora TaxID=362788 RepID=A0A834ST21_9FABA|nr:cysteine-rich receptor-like protein kinase 2 [Senna tora]
MKKSVPLVSSQSLFFLLINSLLLLLPQTVEADPRTRTVQISCGRQHEHNTTLFVPNFVTTMEKISEQMRNSGYGTAVIGTGPDTNYGLAQCYGDLSLLDCVLCYAEARTVLPQCFPNNGGRIYLDGCFMRAENYSFFSEYRGVGDRAVCGNTTRKNSSFQAAVKEAILRAVEAAPNSKGYAREKVDVLRSANESAFVLADCWRSLNTSSCKACLEDASSSILGCLPWSEGRALNTGCFMRYSDTNFLNKEMESTSSKSKVVVIVVAVVSSLIVFMVAIAIGLYVWKQRYIQKKRRGIYMTYLWFWFPGSNDAEKLVKTLHNSLNFKYSTLEKATGSFDETNKLGQGGFGTVYKTWRHFQSGTAEQLFDPNLVQQENHNSNVRDAILRVVHIGLLCTQEIPSLRPSMSRALQMLTKKEEHLPAPSNPPFIDESTMELQDTHDDPFYPLNAADSIATMSHSSFYPR